MSRYFAILFGLKVGVNYNSECKGSYSYLNLRGITSLKIKKGIKIIGSGRIISIISIPIYIMKERNYLVGS